MGHLLAQWRTLGPAQTCLVCRPDDKPLAVELRRLKFPSRQCIVNSEPERGMFSSIVCAARWKGWKPGLTAWAIALGDQPHLSMATLRALLACHRKHPQAICQPVFEGHRRHPVILPRDAFFDLQQSNTTTLKLFLRQTAAPHIECPIMDPGLSCDLDSPSDYERLLPKTRRRQNSKRDNSPLER
jgi:molybdenum cofactor cytidylyltransferase